MVANPSSFPAVGTAVPTPIAPAKPLAQVVVTKPALLVRCTLNEGKPSYTVMDNHACTQQVYTATFLSVPDERNSHPLAKVEINVLSALPFVVGELYTLLLEPVKK